MQTNLPLGIKIIAAVDCIFGLFVLGWFLKISNNFISAITALLSSCPCALIAKIAVLVVILLIVLFIKSGVQIYKLDPRGRNDHINFSSLGIFVLLFPVFLIHIPQGVSITIIVCWAIIIYLVWSIFYLNSPRIKELFKI